MVISYGMEKPVFPVQTKSPVEMKVACPGFQWSNTRAHFRNNKLTGYYSIYNFWRVNCAVIRNGIKNYDTIRSVYSSRLWYVKWLKFKNTQRVCLFQIIQTNTDKKPNDYIGVIFITRYAPYTMRTLW